eukprot:TRINITY_DN32431_c0_g1_i1.p1 TRINITY_DN32431_c0_g1~~TRINITY_DN32431_c0_g1_i1.p1  ORF type:complete len:399 (+),score=63.23 TRINITY_DN32431_c0_g1_i1:76-1272(+)
MSTARIAAVASMFFVLGALQAQMGSRLPALSRSLRLSNGMLSLDLIADDIGILLLLPLAGAACHRWGNPIVIKVSALFTCLMLPLIGLAQSSVELALALAALGGGAGVLDVSMNAEASETERGRELPLMSRYHAVFSLGFGFGGAVAGAAAGLSMSPLFNFISVSAGMLILTGCVSRFLGEPRRSDGDEETPLLGKEENDGPRCMLPTGELLAITACAFLSSVGEGAVGDWASVHFTTELGSSDAWAPIGFVAFNVAMTLTRFVGDHVTNRCGRRQILLLGGISSGLGYIIASLSPDSAAGRVLATTGFLLVGLGLAIIVPVAFSAAGSVSGVAPGVAIASVATSGYMGMLVGPPMIGGVAQLCGGLRYGLGTCGVTLLLIGVFAPWVPERKDPVSTA